MYGLKEPWANGRVFYVGIATDVKKRLEQHIAEAKESCLTLTKSPNLGLFLATFLNGCDGVGELLEANSDDQAIARFFYRTRRDYMAARRNYCDETDALPLDCGWFVHKWLTKKEFLKIIAALEHMGSLRAKRDRAAQDSC